MRVLTIFVRFGSEQYAHAQDELDDVFRRRMPEVERTTLIVDNALSRETSTESGTRTLIGGDNSAGEFSGFDRGVQFIGSNISQYDLVFFSTSAFRVFYDEYLERFNTALLATVTQRPACVGHIDCYNQGIAILGFLSQHWIRTSFFCLPPTEVKVLGKLTTICDGSAFFSGTPEAPFRSDAPLSQEYRDYIVGWLSGEDIGQGVKWHSSFALTPELLAVFERKALAIMNEHLLSIRLRAMGCRLIDATWLATMLGGKEPVRWETNWREQLSKRDRNTLIVSEWSPTLAIQHMHG